jgi:hypothetical protein
MIRSEVSSASCRALAHVRWPVSGFQAPKKGIPHVGNVARLTWPASDFQDCPGCSWISTVCHARALTLGSCGGLLRAWQASPAHMAHVEEYSLVGIPVTRHSLTLLGIPTLVPTFGLRQRADGAHGARRKLDRWGVGGGGETSRRDGRSPRSPQS